MTDNIAAWDIDVAKDKEIERLREAIKNAHEAIAAGDDAGGFMYLDYALKESGDD